MAAGLLVAPSAAGVALTVAGIAVFLARHPIRILLADRQRGVEAPRTSAARTMALAYVAVALAGAGVAFPLAVGPWWLAVVLAFPFALIQLVYDSRLRGRSVAAEISGSLGLTAGAAALVLAGSDDVALAGGLWILVAGRSVGSVLYIRTRLRRRRGAPTSVWPALLWHTAFLVAVGGLAAIGRLPAPTPFIAAALLVRAVDGLSRDDGHLAPQVLGYQEVWIGIATTVAIVTAYHIY